MSIMARQGQRQLLSELTTYCAEGSSPRPSLQTLATELLAELDSLQAPQVAFWAVVVRRVAYPVFFSSAASASSVREEEQREALETLCSGLRGSIAQGCGEGSVFLPRGCMLELASALCDPLLRSAERHLYTQAESKPGPVTVAVRELLSLGEVAVSVSRSVAVPLLTALMKEGSTKVPGSTANALDDGETAAELLSVLLLHSEASIRDGALCHSVYPSDGVVDVDGNGGEASLKNAVGKSTPNVCQKFATTAGLPRILALTALDGLAQQAKEGSVPNIIRSTLVKILGFLRAELNVLLDRPMTTSKPLTPMPLSPTHRVQLRGWQAVLVLGCHADRETAKMLIPELFWHLSTPHLPDVRDYQELLACSLSYRYPDLAVQPLLVPALQNYDANAQVSASLLVVSCYLFSEWAKQARATSDGWKLPEFSAPLVRACVPYLGHNSAYVRGMAAWGFFEIVDSMTAAGGQTQLRCSSDGGDLELLSQLHKFLSSNRECQKMRRRLTPIFQDFEMKSKTSLDSLIKNSEVLPKDDVGREPGSDELEKLPKPLHLFSDLDFRPTETFLTHLKDEVASGMEDLYEAEDPTQYASMSEHWQVAQLAALHALQGEERGLPSFNGSGASSFALVGDIEQKDKCEEDGAAGGVSGLQRKFIPPAPPVLGEEFGGAARRSEDAAAVLAQSRNPLVVVASLVDKTPNLAGLCRTCEVFHCEALCLPNLKVAKEQAFQSISVTAEKWLPLRGVAKGVPLRAQLLELRRKGYAIVGVEQTHTSVPLDRWQFSERTAIVLGAEKEGIDAELLTLMDACVEIPQQGQLRSLNVHVSGSVVIWEYVRQLRMKQVET
eukprot:TRINITY_DN26021_c0_g1_i1.p1 TRINITY_DN26021_c0_g1~~TRINITY_DN26021_c0_g1_i1.p1  ORF type:complete len:862 (+),score=161.15 TRINITY_DN26021_c0_g1_i1:71-2587(+)